MIYEELVTQNKSAFLAKVAEIAAKLKIKADWLMIVMKMESGINHQAVNPDGGATGLIQFTPATAAGYPFYTSTAALKAMSNVDQLDYVYKYYEPYSGKLKSVIDLYTVTFWPVALGKPDSYVLRSPQYSAAKVASQNQVFDLNKDQQITLGEFKKSVIGRLPSEALAYLKKKLDPVTIAIIAVSLTVVIAAYYIYKTMKK